MIGASIGPYQILSELGRGGMGEVYRATDSHLKRSVAVKVLPASVSGDPDRLARFQREAEVLAALNHPNIAQIYGIEESGGVRALVMELVEGEDLAQRLERGAIPVDEALPIARQVAEALEAAHDAGIVHRDLKPANVKVRADGVPQGARLRAGEERRPTWKRGGARAGRLTNLRVARYDRCGHDPRHGGLHGARTGARRPGRDAGRYLGVRRRAVRDAHRHGIAVVQNWLREFAK